MEKKKKFSFLAGEHDSATNLNSDAPEIGNPSSWGEPTEKQKEAGRKSESLERLKQLREEKKEEQSGDSPDEKRLMVLNGATLKCPYAQAEGKLKVTSNELKLQDQLWATEGDSSNMVNLQFPGVCNHPKWGSNKPPCMSVINLGPWQNVGTTLVQEQRVLVKESFITCNPVPNTATAKPIPVVEPILSAEAIGNTIVELLPLRDPNNSTATHISLNKELYPVYKGEYGYDWYQQYDEIIGIQIENALTGGVKGVNPDGTIIPYENKEEALQAFRRSYPRIPLAREYAKSPDKRYYVPRLALFSKPTSEQEARKIQGQPGYKPLPYKAALNFYIDIEKEKPEKLLVKAGPYFSINKQEPGKDWEVPFTQLGIKFGVAEKEMLELECMESFDSPQNIDIFACYKNNPLPQLAGRILAVPNSENCLRRRKIILVDTIMDIYNTGNRGIFQKGKFTTAVIESLHYLHQALIIPEWEVFTEDNKKILDLSQNPHFKPGGECLGWDHDDPYILSTSFKRLEEAFVGKYTRNWEDILAFALGIQTPDKDTGGNSDHPTSNKVNMYPRAFNLLSAEIPTTLPHEVFHNLGLMHTFWETQDSGTASDTNMTNKKFVFVKEKTLNLMDYSTPKYTTFAWQWEIANPNLKGKTK